MNGKLGQMAMAQARRSFYADALARMDKEEQEENGLAILLSNWAQWDGCKLLRVAALALEDANFHDEAGRLSEMERAIYHEADADQLTNG